MLPTLEDHACSLGRRGGFITRLREGTWAGHVAEHIALEFQNLAGTDVRHGKTRGTGEYGRYNVVFEYREEQVGIEAGRMAVALVNHLVAPSDEAFAFDLMAELEKLILPRGAARLRPEHAGAPRRGRRPRHPVHPARPVQPRPARPGRPPAAHPRDDDQPHVGHRGRHRERQEADQPAARLGRPARCRGARSSRPRTTRSPPRDGSATRASSSRSTATTAAASRSTSGARRTSAPRGRSRSARAGARTSSSSRSSPATTTAA